MKRKFLWQSLNIYGGTAWAFSDQLNGSRAQGHDSKIEAVQWFKEVKAEQNYYFLELRFILVEVYE